MADTCKLAYVQSIGAIWRSMLFAKLRGVESCTIYFCIGLKSNSTEKSSMICISKHVLDNSDENFTSAYVCPRALLSGNDGHLPIVHDTTPC